MTGMFSDGDTVLPDGVDSLTFIDDVPEVGNPVGAGIYQCEECGREISTPSGRKPKVMLCEEHRKTSGRQGSRQTRTSPASTQALIDRAVTQLESGYRLVAAGAKFADAEAAGVIGDSADKLAESWRMMLETNKKFRDMFAKMEKTSAWLPVIVAHGDVASAIIMSRALRRAMAQSEAQHRASAEGQESPYGGGFDV